MRLWSIHPKYLDAKGLVALWREALLAQKVLLGKTKGYRNHPQLQRFRDSGDPVGMIAAFLWQVRQEALRRGYNFDATRIVSKPSGEILPVSTGQLEYEISHLKEKLRKRDPERLALWEESPEPVEVNPVFSSYSGEIESWERIQDF